MFIVRFIVDWCCSDSEPETEPTAKKEYVFTNKKDAIEAFKNLLRDKVKYHLFVKFYLLIEVIGDSLTVLVIEFAVISNQLFALKRLVWLLL